MDWTEQIKTKITNMAGGESHYDLEDLYQAIKKRLETEDIKTGNVMREELADLCHKQWSGWMEYLFSKCTAETGQFGRDTGNLVIPERSVERWQRQLHTPYADLSEDERESDRKEADKFIAIMLLQTVAQQAEDKGLWFDAKTAPEAYLQQELRRLHAMIERR